MVNNNYSQVYNKGGLLPLKTINSIIEHSNNQMIVIYKSENSLYKLFQSLTSIKNPNVIYELSTISYEEADEKYIKMSDATKSVKWI